ncbi:hypothetical protein [Yoonia sp. GPGPB17]|uniref:hypothetical protein n=1 Tax=Yoonia sp. GPGPB17 TaxID=3026147 RepID=UPI0030EEFBF2
MIFVVALGSSILIFRSVFVAELLGSIKNFVFFLSLFATIVAASGAFEGMRIRSGNYSDLPSIQFAEIEMELPSNAKVVRNLSNGMLVLLPDDKALRFFEDSSGAVTAFPIDRDPFLGVACYTLDWCGLSGWN